MKKIKSAFAVLLALVLIVSSLAFSFSAYAVTYPNLVLNTLYSNKIDGGGDMIWYTYTPVESGTYSLISYSSGKTIAYLYTRSYNPNGSINYNGLAYAPDNDPDYASVEPIVQETTDASGNPKTVTYTHYKTAFRLTYHLEAGTKYYYSAGFPYESTSSGTIRVMLKQDSVDSNVRSLESVSAVCTSELIRYNDGEWRVDSNGERYYEYNISKVIQNTAVTLHYSDGTSTTETGSDVIDDYRIMYINTQETNHWYDENDENYTHNIMRINVSNISCEYDVPVGIGENYTARGIVTDYTDGSPVDNADIYWKNILLSTTNDQGEFNISYPYGTYYVVVEREDAFPREICVTISKSFTANNHTDNPVPLFVGDYVRDGIINGKDAAFISKNLTGNSKEREMQKFPLQFGIRECEFLYSDFSL